MLLDLKGITVQFGGLIAVNELDLSVEKGEIVTLIGPNGAGKTTVLNVLSRFYTPISGSYTFNGVNMLNYPAHKVIKKGVARSFQNVELFKNMTVIENLLVGEHTQLRTSVIGGLFRTPSVRREEREAAQRVERILELFGIADLRNQVVSNLSFGLQKTVDMARALIAQPQLLLLDEPVAGMNPTETEQFGNTVLRLRKEFGVTVLMIEHDMPFVMKLSDRIVVIDFGKKIAEGLPKEIQNNPDVIKAYLGEGDELVC